MFLKRRYLLGSLFEKSIKTPRKFSSFYTWVQSRHHSTWWDFCLFWPLPLWPLLNVQLQRPVWKMNSSVLALMMKRLDAMPWILAWQWRTQMVVLVIFQFIYFLLLLVKDFIFNLFRKLCHFLWWEGYHLPWWSRL